MTKEWTEEWVRGATGWKPFKEGKALHDNGQVTAFKLGGNACQAAIKEGRQTLRPTVKVLGPADIQAQCGCIENRSTGAICSHAVAVLLAAVAARNSRSEPGSVSQAPSKTRSEPAAWTIRLSSRFRDELSAGRLAVRLLPAQGPPTDADKRLAQWLGPSGATRNSLLLTEEDWGAFLDAVAGHPRIEVEGGSQALVIEPDPGPPLRLRDSRLEKGALHLSIEQPSAAVFVSWGTTPALAGPDFIRRLPVISPDSRWISHVRELISHGSVKLPIDEALPALDAWLDLLETPRSGWLGELCLQTLPPQFVFEFEGTLDAIDGTLKVAYPGLAPVALPPADQPLPGLPRLDTQQHRALTRHPEAERQAVNQLLWLGFEATGGNDRFKLKDRARILDWISDGIRSLEGQAWTLRPGTRFQQIASKISVVRPKIRSRPAQGIAKAFKLSFTATDGNAISSAEVRRILRGSQRAFKRPDGGAYLLSRTCGEMVEPLMEDLGVGRFDEPFRVRQASAIVFENLSKFLAKSLECNLFQSFSSVDLNNWHVRGLEAKLRDYQRKGVAWLYARLTELGGALLADEMGLGKTIQTIASIIYFKDKGGEGPSLVAVPASLVGNWQIEIARFAPKLRCLVLHGADRDRLRDQVGKSDVIVTSYGTLVRDLAFHLQREYRLIVADEASLLRNAETDNAKALFKLRARARLALTGTPIENRPRDLWSLFQFIAPGYLGGLPQFCQRYELPMDAGEAAVRGVLQRLQLRVSPFILRRTKEEVAKDLPEKLQIDEWLALAPSQARLYASLSQSGLEEIERIREREGKDFWRMHLLTLLLRLRQICVDPGLLNVETDGQAAIKIDRLFEILQEQKENGLKTLVFSQFVENLRRIEKRMEKRYGTVFRLDGSTRNRFELVQNFQQCTGPAVFLISLKAGGYGLNLTAANTVVHMDPWWNPAAEAQATDRAHRIGQARPVTVYRLLTRDTVEERVHLMQRQKRTIIEALTGGGDQPANWTMDDLESLVRT